MRRLHLIIYIFTLLVGISAENVNARKSAINNSSDLAQPQYILRHYTEYDSIYIKLYHKDKDAKIYANINGDGSRNKATAMEVNLITLPYWRYHDYVTAWAESGEKISEIVIIYPILEETTNDDNYNELSIADYVNISKGIQTTFRTTEWNAESFTSITDNNESATDKDILWQVNVGGQHVIIDQERTPTNIIGDDNGPIDIYSAGATPGALLFGKGKSQDSQRAYIQSINKVSLPAVVDVHIQGDSESKVNQRLGIKISFDGDTWNSVDTLNTDQLKPIRRFEVKIPEQGDAFIRLESMTEPATESLTWIYDIKMIYLDGEKNDLPTTKGDKRIVERRYFDLLGDEYTTPLHGQICIEMLIFDDSTRSSRLMIRQ